MSKLDDLLKKVKEDRSAGVTPQRTSTTERTPVQAMREKTETTDLFKPASSSFKDLSTAARRGNDIVEAGKRLQEFTETKKEDKLSWGEIFGAAARTPDSTIPLSNSTSVANYLRTNPDEVEKEFAKADEYAEERKAQQKRAAATAKENKVTSSLASIPASLLSLTDWLTRRTEEMAIGVALPRKDLLPGEYSRTVRGAVSEELSPVGSFLYNTAMSGADSLGAGVLGAGGLPLFFGAATAAEDAVIAKGGSKEQAIQAGLAAGVFESLFESFSIGQLRAMKEVPVNSAKDVLTNVVKSTLTNASEEAATEIANIIYDTKALGELSDYAQAVEAYMANEGLSEQEARKRATQDMVTRVGESALAGALMGTAFAGIASGSSVAAQHSADSRAGKAFQKANEQFTLVQQAMKFAPESRTYQMAANLAQKLDSGDSVKKAVSSAEYGRLATIMEEEMQQFGPAKPVEAARAQEAANPEVQVVDPVTQAFLDAGDTTAEAARKADTMRRVSDGDTTLTRTQLRKLRLNTPTTRAVFQKVTGVVLPDTTDTNTLIEAVQEAVARMAENNITTAMQETAARQQAEAQVAAEVQAQAENAAQQLDIVAQLEQEARRAADAAEKGAPAPNEEQINEAASIMESAVEAAESAAPAVVRLSDGTTVAHDEFVSRYMAQNPAATEAKAISLYNDAVRLNGFGHAYPAEMVPPVTEQPRRSVDRQQAAVADVLSGPTMQEQALLAGDQTAQRQDVAAQLGPVQGTKEQEWTGRYLNEVSQKQGGPEVKVVYGQDSSDNGFFDETSNTIFLNGDRLTTQRMLTEVLGHEFVHVGKAGGSDIVDRILDFAGSAGFDLEKMYDERTEAYVAFYTKLFQQRDGMAAEDAAAEARALCTPEFMDDEVAGDVMREIFRNSDALYRMAQDAPRVLQDLQMSLSRMTNRLQSVLPGASKNDNLYGKIVANEARAISRRLDRALKKYGNTATVGFTATQASQEPVAQAPQEPVAQAPQEPRFSVESDSLIAELNQADKDDYTPLDMRQQSLLWNIPEIANVRREKFTKTVALSGRKELRDQAFDTLDRMGSWNGSAYEGPVNLGKRADIVIGLPGSGKSSTAVNPLSQKHGSRVIDSDMAKELLPEYNNGKGAKMVHEESSSIRDRLYQEAISRGENFVLATVGVDANSLIGKIERLKREGYTVGIHYVDVTPKQAAARILSRFLPGGEPGGRYTPPDVLLDAGNGPKQTYERLVKRGDADEYQQYDNRDTRREDPAPSGAGGESGRSTGSPADVRPGNGSTDGVARRGRNVGGAAGEALDISERSVQQRAGEDDGRATRDRGYDRYAPNEPLFGIRDGVTRNDLKRISKLRSFKNWFKDGNGELRDRKTGLPVVVFHGTSTAGYTRFVEQSSGEPGFWFAGHPHTSGSPYYLNTDDADVLNRAFIPESLRSWEQAEDYVFRAFPNLELREDIDESGLPVYTVFDADDGGFMGEYAADEEGLRRFDRELQDLSAMAWEKSSYGDRIQGGSPGVYQMFLSMENPLLVYGEGSAWNRLSPFMAEDNVVQDYLSAKNHGNDTSIIPAASILPTRQHHLVTRDFVEAAQALGYDGVIFRDIQDGRAEEVSGTAGASRDAGLYQQVLDIIAANNNFGAPTPEMGVAVLEVSGVPDSVDSADAVILESYLNGAPSTGSEVSISEVPDDVYVVFDSNQIKSVNNTGEFSTSNPDIRYSVDSKSPFSEQVNTALRDPDSENRFNALYIKDTPRLLQELGVPDLPLTITAKHVKRAAQPSDTQGGTHGISPDVLARTEELLADPAMVLESQVRQGTIVVVTDEVNDVGLPIVYAIKPNGTSVVDWKIGPSNFILSAYGRGSFGKWLQYNRDNVLYWNKEKSLRLPVTDRVPSPASVGSGGSTDGASPIEKILEGVPYNTIIRKIPASVNPTPNRRFSVAKKSGNVLQAGGSTGNVNPDTGYERGSLADSFMRIMNTGDRQGALSMLEKAAQTLARAEADAAEARQNTTVTDVFRPKLTEDAVQRNKRTIEALIQKYGEMPQTSGAQQEVHMPKKVDPNTKVRGFYQTAAASSATIEPVLNELERDIVNGSAGATYAPVGDKATLDEVKKDLSEKGFDRMLREWQAVIESGAAPTKSDIARGEQLYIEACNNRDVATAQRLAAEIAVAGTRAGQAVQAMTLLKKMTPSGNLYYMQKAVDNLNRDLEGKNKPKIKIDPKLAKALLEAETQADIDAAMDNIIQDLANQTPVTLADQWNTWRYLAMLGNPRTHIRNLLGNAIFVPARLAKDAVAATMELALPREQRTKGAGFLHADLRKLAKDDAKEMRDVLRSGGKYNPADLIRDRRKIFRGPLAPLNFLEKVNSAALEGEDLLFLNAAYEHALSGFLAARGAKAADVSGPDSTVAGRKLLEEARAYAVNEAKKATYRDMSRLASWLNYTKRNSGPVGKILLDGLVPFTKTPVNIVRRGIEYSPAGLVKGLTDAMTKVRSGKMSAAEAIDEVAAGMTGSGILLLGAYLASQGILSGGFDDDDEDNFKELQGYQEYALQIGDTSYTVDWTAPVALPLFVGAEVFNAMNEDREASLSDVADAITTILEPMLSLSMLDGLNKTLSSNRYGEADDALYNILSTVATSYVSQGVPTLAGQIARTIDDSRRASFTPKGTGKLESWLNRSWQTSVQGKTPVYAEDRMLYIDNWGRADTEGSVAMRAFENFLSPGYVGSVKTTAVDEELARLADAVKETTVYPDRARSYFSVNGAEYAMTQEEYQAHLIDRGRTSFRLVDDMIHSEAYRGLSNQEKKEAVLYAYEYASDMAKVHTNSDYTPGSKWVEKLAEYEQSGGDAAEYLMVRGISKVSGVSLTEAALRGDIPGLSDVDRANIVFLETTQPTSFTDPYTAKHEYIMTTEQQKMFADTYFVNLQEGFRSLAASNDYRAADLATRYELVKELKSDVNANTKKQISNWLYNMGIQPTPKS